MKSFEFGCYALISWVAEAMLAGCGGSQPPIGVPQTSALATHADRDATETVLYSFAGGDDGQYPEAAPILVDGEFYGTTVLDGNGGCRWLRNRL